MLKSSTSDAAREWFAVELQAHPNEVGGRPTTEPRMPGHARLLASYEAHSAHAGGDRRFHVALEPHPSLQDGNGRVGRLVM